jgi:hypothetical protein
MLKLDINISSKSNDKDNSIYSRLPEREDQAESLLARIECLPPLNFSGERFFEVSNRLTGNSPLPCPKVIFKDYFKNEKLGGTTCLLNSSLFQGRVFLFL